MDAVNPVGSINRLEIVNAIAEMKYNEPLEKPVQMTIISYTIDAHH